MILEEYRSRYAILFDKINLAKKILEQELTFSHHEFNKAYHIQQLQDKEWFAQNLDYILKNKKHFETSPGLGDIVIDFLLPYYNGGLVAGVAWNSPLNFKLYLKDLLYLWDIGFCYNGYPILSYKEIRRYERTILIEYVKNSCIEIVKDKYVKGQNSLALSQNIISKLNSLNIADLYPDWQTYKTISVIKNTLKKES